MNMTQLNTIPGGKLLRKHILTGDVLFAVWLPSLHSIWRTSISLALSLCILTWIIPHGLNVTNATPHAIYSMAPGNPCKLSEINISFVHFFAADSFRSFILCVLVDLPPPFNVCLFRLCCVSLCLIKFAAWYLQNRLCCVSLALKMARKKMCLGTPKKKKKSPCCGGRPPGILTAAAPPNLPQGPVVQPTRNTSGTGSHHCNQKLNQWDVERMKCALEEWCYWEDRRVRMGLKNLEMLKAQIAKKYGLSPSTFGNHMLGKVQGYEHCSGGAWQPRVLSAGKQLICFSTDTLFGVHVGKLI